MSLAFSSQRSNFALLLAFVLAAAPLVTRAQLGSKAWDYDTSGRIYASPAIGTDGTIYVGNVDGNLYALRSNGALRWQWSTNAAFYAAPSIGANETVYAADAEGRVHALTSAGVRLWTTQTGGYVAGSLAIAVDGTILVGTRDGSLYALSPQGQIRWTFKTDGEIENGPTLGADGTIYFGNRAGVFYALTPAGNRRWSIDLGRRIEGTAAIGPDGTVYVGDLDGRLNAFAPAGQVRWTYDAGDTIYSSPAVAPNGSIYLTSGDGTVHALNPDGTLAWKLRLNTRLGHSSIALGSDGALYFGGLDGKIYGLPRNATEPWSYLTQGSINHSSPVLSADALLFIGSEDGHLYAIRTSSGPAAGVWPMYQRDARHTASGFVERRLPSGYSAGMELLVTLNATPPAGLGYYTVEDVPPTNWQVSTNISHGGYFDSGTRRVRFGPYTDGQSRQLTYAIRPPLNESSIAQFAGTSAARDSERLLGGDHTLKPVPLHPADLRPVDTWMTVREVTEYAAAWRRSSTWPVPPSPVPSSYVEKAIELWKTGEFYRYDTNRTSAPLWFTTPGDPNYAGSTPDPVDPGTVAANGSAIANASLTYEIGVPQTIAITVIPAASVSAYAVEDQPPAGWEINPARIGQGGVFDPQRRKIKWGPFLDTITRILTYEVTPAGDATLTASFAGVAAYDGSRGVVLGQRTQRPKSSGIPTPFAVRRLPNGYSPGAVSLVSIETVAVPNATFVVVEDTPPAGWAISAVSDGGIIDANTGTIRFGPFLDGASRRLTYQLTPPLTETNLERFYGTFLLDDFPGMVQGQDTLEPVPLHPADLAQPDRWLTLPEVTAYGRAWKRGLPWQVPPTPVPPAYIARAIDLWRGGEGYSYNAAAGDPPACWLNLASLSLTNPPPEWIGDADTSAGSAEAEPLKLFTPGAALTIKIVATPATNTVVYGVEDRLPADWPVAPTAISHGGVFDAHWGKVKWGPFFDAQPRELTYTVLPPLGTTNRAEFIGGAAFDAITTPVEGPRYLYPTGSVVLPVFTQIRYQAGTGALGTFLGEPGELYVLESASDAATWLPLGVFTNLSGTVTFIDPSTNRPRRFYRVLWP